MKSWKQRIDEQVANGSLRRPCIYVPVGYVAEIWVQTKGSEYQISLLKADQQGLITVEGSYFGHGDVSSNCRIWIMQSNVQVWLKPKTIDNNYNKEKKMSDDSKNNGFMEYNAEVEGVDDKDRIKTDNTIPGTFTHDANGSGHLPKGETYHAVSNDSGHEEQIMSTLQTSYGSPQADTKNLDIHRCTVEVSPGMRTSVANALKLGFLQRDAGGNLRDGQPGDIGYQEDIKPDVNMSPVVHESVNELRAAVGHNNADAMLHSVIGAVLNSEPDDGAAFGNFSSQLSIEAEEGASIARTITEDLGRNLIDKTAAKYNLDPNSLIGFLRSCTPEIQTQLVLRTLHGDPSVLQELASRHRFKNIR